MEKIQTSRLYPERASAGLDKKIETLQGVLSGEIPTWEMSESERSAILLVEQELGAKLKVGLDVQPQVLRVDVAYLLTEKGLEEFEAVAPQPLPETTDLTELQKYLYETAAGLSTVEAMKAFNTLGGNSVKYREGELLREFSDTMDADGHIDTTTVSNSDFLYLNLTPENDYSRTRAFRDLKSEIKTARAELLQSEQSDDYKAMLDGIYELYQKRINELIAEDAKNFISIAKKESVVGTEGLSEAEKQALEEARGSGDVPETLSRYDKFMTGAGDYNEEGWRTQVSAELLAFADEEEALYMESGLNQDETILEKGLSKEKIFAAEIGPDKIREYCEETLAHYDLLSSYPLPENVASRAGAAEDGKWQVDISSAYQSLAADGIQKVLKCPDKSVSVERLLTVIIAHEIEGHAIQHNNRGNIPLQLFEQIGADRSTIFAEAGAMSNQNYVSEEAFGFKDINDPPYIRAMSIKLAGGTYADCVEAFYESSLKPVRKKNEEGAMTEDEFNVSCKQTLQKSINRARRLFRGGSSKSDTSPHLAESKATVYLEQVQLARKLTEAGLDQTLNLTGVNLDALVFLVRAKLLTIEDIQKPDFYALQIWDRIKSEYQLETAE